MSSFDINDDVLNTNFLWEIFKGHDNYVEKEMIIKISEYYKFQKEIELYFSKGINKYAKNKKEIFYFLDSNWVHKWKLFINYDKVIKYINSNFEIIVEEQPNYWPGTLKSGKSFKNFFQKTLLNPNDFECLVNESIFNYLNQYFCFLKIGFNFIKRVKSIEGFFLIIC